VSDQLSDHIALYHEHGLWIPDRKIYLSRGESGEAEVDNAMAERLIKNIHILEGMSREPITVIINSPGGSVVDGYAMFDIIDASSCRMTGVVTGEASSMAALVLQAFDYRKAYRNAVFVLHDGSDELKGVIRDVEKAAEYMRSDRLKQYEILEGTTNHDRYFWSRKLSHDLYLTAHQALELGLIDEVI
jgi:ATP-dependent Clp protease protease subunit